jgi:hypothetical protein
LNIDNKLNARTMKRPVSPLLLTLLIAAFVGCAPFRGADSGSEKKSKKPDITGSWKLESYKYGTSSGAFASADAGIPRIKLITGNSFQWVHFDASTKRIVKSAGGSYTLEGDAYTEMLEYGLNMEQYIGTQSVFKVKVEKDVLFISGKLSTGYPIEEVWQRVK